MKRMTAEEVASEMARLAELGEVYPGWTPNAAYEHSRDLVRTNIVPQYQDVPDADGWHWCEQLEPDLPPQKLRSYRPLNADGEGKFYVDFNGGIKWQRWTVSGWVPLVGRVCPIGARPQ